MTLKINKGGYTLIELLIYTAIFAISVGVFSSVLITFTRVQTRTSADAELTQQLSFVQSTIQRLVRESANIQNSVEDIASSSLVLRMASSTLDPTIISSDANGIYLKQGTGETAPLTNNQVKVSQFEVTKYENPNAHAIVHINLSLTYNSQNPYQQITRALKIAIGRVSAATFDDSLIPNANNSFSLGDATNRWKDINISNLLNVGQLINDPVAGAQNGSIYYNTSSSVFRGYKAGEWQNLGEGFWAATSTNDIYNTNSGNVGIGTASPGAKLEIAGQIKITGGSPGAGKILSSDASGLASWTTTTGIVGQDKRNLEVKRNVTNPNYQIDIDAERLIVEDVALSNINLTADITVSGANGLDVDSEQASTWYSLWVIYNPTTATTAGLLSTSTAPIMPSGYTKNRRVGWVRNDASSNFLNFIRVGDWTYWDSDVIVFSGVASDSWVDLSLAVAMPPSSTLASFDVNAMDWISNISTYVAIRPNGSNWSVNMGMVWFYGSGVTGSRWGIAGTLTSPTDSNQVIEIQGSPYAVSIYFLGYYDEI